MPAHGMQTYISSIATASVIRQEPRYRTLTTSNKICAGTHRLCYKYCAVVFAPQRLGAKSFFFATRLLPNSHFFPRHVRRHYHWILLIQ